MKVAFFMSEKHSGRGGTEQVLLDIFESLQAENINCSLYYLYQFAFPDFLKKLRGKVCFYNSMPQVLARKHLLRPRFLFRYCYEKSKRDIIHKIAKDRPDILLVVNMNPEFAPYIKLFKTLCPNTPVLSYFHLSINNQLQEHSTVEFLHLFDAHVAISSGMKDDIFAVVKNKPIYLVYNPIKSAAPVLRAQDATKFIYLGRCDDKNKRVYELLRIMERLRGKWTLDIFGNGGDDPQEIERIEAFIAEQLPDKVKFHGWQEKPWEMIEEASVLLLHSNSVEEVQPLVLCEAMARGIPCVSSFCAPGLREILVPEQNGWLYDLDDEEACQKILQDIIDKKITLPPPCEVTESMRKFSAEQVTANFISALESEIKKHKIKNQLDKSVESLRPKIPRLRSE
ncbi:MAG: glycosyltransferase [Acidaminococcaceae bacterium]